VLFFCLEPVLSSPKVVTRSTEGAQSRERSGAMLNVSRTFTLYGHYIKPMPRSPLPRTLFAMLPILGALLAALAAHRNWPIPLSLLAMAVIALAAAVIYWSAPLSKRKSALPVEASLPAASVPEVAAATAEPPANLAATLPAINIPFLPEHGSIGTRADALATGKASETDLLTGLLGSEAFFAKLTSELRRCKAANQTAILVICDLDAFSEINQNYGLIDGNRMLRQVADCFRMTIREGDTLSRLGGDEFGIFFPGLTSEIAEARVRNLRAAVREAGLLTLPEGSPQMTACIGISCFPTDGDTVDTLVAAADLSLIKAKHERREKADRPIPSALVLTRG
jgi:diguanylate cyclase (GGDEF)-like protein